MSRFPGLPRHRLFPSAGEAPREAEPPPPRPYSIRVRGFHIVEVYARDGGRIVRAWRGIEKLARACVFASRLNEGKEHGTRTSD